MRGGGPDSRKTFGLLLAALLCAGPGGCSSEAPSVQVANSGGRIHSLSAAQSAAIEAGLRQMTEDANATPAGPVVAMAFEGEPGAHVCGHVKQGREIYPWYIELRDRDGKPVAERGQVGSDPSRRSKVTFMCRRHRTG